MFTKCSIIILVQEQSIYALRCASEQAPVLNVPPPSTSLTEAILSGLGFVAATSLFGNSDE